jgi:hypothetical protein
VSSIALGGWVTHGVRPGTRGSGEVPTARIPLDVRDAIMVRSAKLLYTSTPLLLRWVLFRSNVVRVEVEIPELEFGFGR